MLDLTGRPTLDELRSKPSPNNHSLQALIQHVDRIQIKDGGVYDEESISDIILLNIDQPKDIIRIGAFLEIDESKTGFYCCCTGSYGIELFRNGKLLTTIGLHHGTSIRYAAWNSDAILVKNEELLECLAEMSCNKPLCDWEKVLAATFPERIKEKNWLYNSPRCFSKYTQGFFEGNEEQIVTLMAEFEKEIPSPERRVIALLQSFGNTDNFWNDYPDYEKIPQLILNNYTLEELAGIYSRSDKNYKTRRGLGRYIGLYNFTEKGKKQLNAISAEILDELIKCFKSLNNESGIEILHKLKAQKNA
ncbi:MAG: hypothetical protein J7578_01380 [Chitinophagaceae bacterium]|nr:hypothetical protein [Chitinophagaceae bacterium]